MAQVFSFPPIETPSARVLILGSMPGERSLRAGQYYANPQNAFWGIVGAFCGFPADLAYADRVQELCRAGIAVWDVLQSCERSGSLDAAIVAGSERANDLAGFLIDHPAVCGVLCNGQKARVALRRVALPTASSGCAPDVVCLPSTSPAHAGTSRVEKSLLWHAALKRFLGG